MAEISAKDVMKLRNKTGLAMMACKKALQETGGDVDAAEDYLRKQLKGKMDTRTERPAGEGRLAIAINEAHTAAAIIELRAETDFTAKNEAFVKAANDIAKMAINEHAGEVSVTDEMNAPIDNLRITTGENCSYARGHKLIGEAGKTTFGSYVHHDGKTGVLIQAEGSVGEDTLRQICMHITAAVPRPMGVTAADIPAHLLEKERAFRIEQAKESGKPQEIAEKIVEGGMQKFISEIALVEQDFVIDPSKKIKDLLGPDASISGFFRWEVGETSSD
ncbi:MAG: translation elongation factor Ts [Phycisphaerales bacterium JB037]|jgi:elongation factor Ts